MLAHIFLQFDIYAMSDAEVPVPCIYDCVMSNALALMQHGRYSKHVSYLISSLGYCYLLREPYNFACAHQLVMDCMDKLISPQKQQNTTQRKICITIEIQYTLYCNQVETKILKKSLGRINYFGQLTSPSHATVWAVS